ncbi:hypothetical protein CMO96_03160 [Candidatus Woesebacteria bacterium]|nr:hypothetical protein [Candidatus Woesebacteria bacterium]
MAKVVFFGTPDYVLSILIALNKQHEIVAVVTQTAKPVGRKQEVVDSPVAEWAKKHKVKIVTDLQNIRVKADVGVLAAYGRIIPKKVIDMFPSGIVNIHPSLLPKYRGASPTQATIVSGDRDTGVSLMQMDEEMDHGLIIAQFKEKVRNDDTGRSLLERLFTKSAKELAKILQDYLDGKLKPVAQEHDKATYTTLFKKEYGFVPPKYVKLALNGKIAKSKWSVLYIQGFSLVPNPKAIERFIRAVSPWPNAWTEIKVTSNKGQVTRKLKILRAHAKDGKLILDQVQLEGKSPVSWNQFRQGYPEAIF